MTKIVDEMYSDWTLWSFEEWLSKLDNWMVWILMDGCRYFESSHIIIEASQQVDYWGVLGRSLCWKSEKAETGRNRNFLCNICTSFVTVLWHIEPTITVFVWLESYQENMYLYWEEISTVICELQLYISYARGFTTRTGMRKWLNNNIGRLEFIFPWRIGNRCYLVSLTHQQSKLSRSLCQMGV